MIMFIRLRKQLKALKEKFLNGWHAMIYPQTLLVRRAGLISPQRLACQAPLSPVVRKDYNFPPRT